MPHIGAIVPIYPPVDMAALHAHSAATQYPLAYTGGTPAQFPQRYAAVSPIRSTAAANPPALILTGLDDSLVPRRGYIALRAARAWRRARGRIDRAAAHGHGFDMLPGSIGNQIVRSATLKFLARQDLAP